VPEEAGSGRPALAGHEDVEVDLPGGPRRVRDDAELVQAVGGAHRDGQAGEDGAGVGMVEPRRDADVRRLAGEGEGDEAAVVAVVGERGRRVLAGADSAERLRLRELVEDEAAGTRRTRLSRRRPFPGDETAEK
jgi:hypothetical protein